MFLSDNIQFMQEEDYCDSYEKCNMRIRIKFTKTGQLKYIGHLDVMRYFQKVLRRAHVDVVFTEGFSPHMIMSFALPLGVGIESTGEYFDVDVKDDYDIEGLTERLNRFTTPYMKVLDAVRVSDKKADKCMTLVEAADYRIDLSAADDETCRAFAKFVTAENIMTVKKTKSGEKLTDIRPMILSCEPAGEKCYELRLSAGSRAHLNPALLLDAFRERCGTELPITITRTEMYTVTEGKYIPLSQTYEKDRNSQDTH